MTAQFGIKSLPVIKTPQTMPLESILAEMLAHLNGFPPSYFSCSNELLTAIIDDLLLGETRLHTSGAPSHFPPSLAEGKLALSAVDVGWVYERLLASSYFSRLHGEDESNQRRKSLGSHYTPPQLAQDLLDQS